MGMCSWKTSDSQRSIRVDKACKVYLLQPGDLPPIEEPSYEGYGEFGGINAHAWLARMNVPTASDMDHEAQRMLGVSIECGELLVDAENGDYWHIMDDLRDLVPGHFFPGRYDDPIPEFNGKTANDLLGEKRLVSREIRDIYTVSYPLKFSFSANADYDSLPAAEQCPDQGFL